MEGDEPPPVGEAGIGRLLAFSDAVFAIAFTILVLDLVVPAGLPADQLRVTLRELTPQLLSAALSFALIGRFWVAHHGSRSSRSAQRCSPTTPTCRSR